MKRTNEQSLKQALEGLVQDYGLGAKLDEQELRALWPEAGPLRSRLEAVFPLTKRGKLMQQLNGRVKKNKWAFDTKY